MRILLTGGSGIIGSELKKRLRGTTHEIITVGRSQSEHDHALNLCDSESVVSVLSQIGPIDCVVHLAAKAHELNSTSREEIYAQNVSSTRNLMEGLTATSDLSRLRFIFASTVAVFEKGPKTKLSPYAESKLAAEDLLVGAGFGSLRVLRFAPIYSTDILRDISKRVLIPGTAIKLKLLPEPAYCVCDLNTAVESIIEAIERNSESNKIVVSDVDLVPQSALAKLIPGKWVVPFPRILLQLLGRFLAHFPGIPGRIGILVKKVADPDDFRKYVAD